MASGRVREYVALVTRLWGRLIAGPIAAVCSLIGLVVGLSLHLGPTATSVLSVVPLADSILLIWPAQYEAWKQERVERELEVAKNQKPDLRGEAYDFSRNQHGTITSTMSSDEGWTVFVPFHFTLSVTNHRQATTNLSKLILDATDVQPAVSWLNINDAHSVELEYAKIVRLF